MVMVTVRKVTKVSSVIGLLQNQMPTDVLLVLQVRR